MIELSKVAIEPQEIVVSLKQNIEVKEVAQKVLYEKIINQSAQERGLTITPEEIQIEAEHQRREKHLEKASDTLEWLADQLITSDDWEAGIRDRLLAKKLSECLFNKEAKIFFAQNRLDFEQILLYQILVPYEKLAQELFYQIQEQEISFYEAAHFYDIDERRKQQCGYEGKLYRRSLKLDVAAVVFGAQPGKVLDPLKTEQGYHLFKVEEFIPAELTPELHQDIINRMFKEWLASELNYMLHNQTS